jgi:peptidoglycan/xylan/chitin deacetylase (PgdA/CDA1 family)
MVRPAAIVLSVALVCSTACRSLHRGEPPKSPLSRCNEELAAVPEAAAVLKPRTAEQSDPEALKGIQVALTLEGMISLKVDPSADLDDWCYVQNTRENFNKLISTLKEKGMPPTVAFSVGKHLDSTQVVDWLKSGNIVGNMTFDRPKLKKVPLDDFVASIAKEDEFLSKYSKEYPQQKRYFRYPPSKGDRDAAKRPLVSAYLKKQGYLEAPFTVQGRDDRFSQIYCAALARGDQSCANLVKVVFKSVLLEDTIRARKVAASQTGHDLKQVLVVGANQLVLDTLGEILDQLKAMGVTFIPLDQALTDPYYQKADLWEAARRLDRATRRSLRAEVK